MIGREGIKMSQEKVKAILEWKSPSVTLENSPPYEEYLDYSAGEKIGGLSGDG